MTEQLYSHKEVCQAHHQGFWNCFLGGVVCVPENLVIVSKLQLQLQFVTTLETLVTLQKDKLKTTRARYSLSWN